MRFYTKQPPFSCGLDLHARTMDVGLLDQAGATLLHRNMQATPEALLTAMAPSRDQIVMAAACLFPWYWLVDLWAAHGIPCVLGHALSMQAIHGGKATNDTIDAQTIAVLLRGGLLPQAEVSPAAMRATRDLLRRRMPLARTRGEPLAQVHNTNRHYTLPTRGTKIASKAHRDGVAARFATPAVQKGIAIALARIGYDDEGLRDLALALVKAAKHHDANPLSLVRTGPGLGTMLRLGLLDAIHARARFPEAVLAGAGWRFLVSPRHVCQCLGGHTLRHLRDHHGPCASHVGLVRSRRLLPAGESRRPDLAGQRGETTPHGHSLDHPGASIGPGRLCHGKTPDGLCSAHVPAGSREGSRCV